MPKTQQVGQSSERAKMINDGLAILLGGLSGVENLSKDSIALQYEGFLKQHNQIQVDLEFYKNENQKYLKLICKLLAWVEYRNKWKILTKKIDRKTRELKRQKVNNIPNDIPNDLRENLAEAYQCYVLDLKMACQVMLLRSIEIAINHIYDKRNETQSSKAAKFIPTGIKLKWLEENKIIQGVNFKIAKAFIEGRNEVVHEVYHPTDLEIIGSMETILRLINVLNSAV